jgi:hypothetical protein
MLWILPRSWQHQSLSFLAAMRANFGLVGLGGETERPELFSSPLHLTGPCFET